MKESFLAYAAIARDIVVSPVSFFRGMSITEGIRRATYFALLVYYIRCFLFFLGSYQQGYFFTPRFQATIVVTVPMAIFMALMPFLFLLILYAQSIFLYRIGNFFGGTANLEGAYKVLAFVLFLSIFQFIPYLNVIVHTYAIILLIIGIREVFNIDWISSILALFFSFVFTAFLYIILFFVPAYLTKLVVLRM